MRRYLMSTVLLLALLCLLAGCGQRQAEAPEEQQPSAGETAGAEDAPQEAPETQETQAETGQAYTDNFSVDQAGAEAFAAEIQAAVADRDLEGLADLMTFPNYVGFAEDPQFVDTREDFLALDADRIFSEELLSEIAAADLSALEPSEAGFLLSGSGCPNIVFGVSEGRLAIVGINY